ncbi:hypothetical protein BDP81DRAFT_189609 [Colletotrichum phormii]|uniref:Uncharacterized protein n=1 Tax=Colletotrichum phormii TaxID=359342 RepID=A0AAI9ZXA7_9PEZI|nr:uncharacterized protein BDP81DRAFT_189609 [Colletotrichum phormii]KAK1638658.1 hypothetical protein BDP81DRAFT_189609 [Colletotrichum phormii]
MCQCHNFGQLTRGSESASDMLECLPEPLIGVHIAFLHKQNGDLFGRHAGRGKPSRLWETLTHAKKKMVVCLPSSRSGGGAFFAFFLSNTLNSSTSCIDEVSPTNSPPESKVCCALDVTTKKKTLCPWHVGWRGIGPRGEMQDNPVSVWSSWLTAPPLVRSFG